MRLRATPVRHQLSQVFRLLSGMGLALLLSLVQIPSPAVGEPLDRVLAIVEGHVIMQSDVRAFQILQLTEPSGGDEGDDKVLAYLIERRLMLEEVDRYAVADPPAALVDQRMDDVRSRFPHEAAFATALAEVGYTESDLRQVLRDDERRSVYVEDRFTATVLPTDQQLRQYYERHADDFRDNGQVPALDEIRAQVRERLIAEQRDTLVADWVSRLVRQGQVVRVPTR